VLTRPVLTLPRFISGLTARRPAMPAAQMFTGTCSTAGGHLCVEMSVTGGAEDEMREIVFDTETTGLDAAAGDRLVEIGCIELINRFPTGRTFHRYINPERDMPEAAFAVHGLSGDFLNSKPRFAAIAEELLDFIGDAALVAHNATFDLSFLNAELSRIRRAAIPRDRLVDTLLLARRRFPGGSNRLDDLCVRFGIDNSRRTKHGALLDAELLAEVYVELVDARQARLGLVMMPTSKAAASSSAIAVRVRPVPLLPRVSAAERVAHSALIASLGDKAIWRDYADRAASRQIDAGVT
jgi:DNA polymerase III subunit epsilon